MSTDFVPQMNMAIKQDELPIETVVVRDRHNPAFAVGSQPIAKPLHDFLRLLKSEALFVREAADGKCVWNERLRSGFQFAVKRSTELGFDDDRPKADHGIVARYRAVGFHINHDVRHWRYRLSFRFE